MPSETAATQLAQAAALYAQDRKEDAYKAYLAIAQAHPAFAPAHIGLGDVLYDVVQLDMAIAAFRAALQLDPGNAQTHFKLGNALKEQNNLAAAVEAYREAIRLKPDLYEAWQRMIYTLSFAQLITPQEHVAVARQFDMAVRKGRPAASIDVHGPDAEGRLRVGFISAEIGAHVVSRFLESYLRHYDRTRIHLTLYSTVARREPEYAALCGLADAVRELEGVSDDAARDIILRDRIDVLIDTTNHMLHSRLAMLAQRCAPIQCHYIGYISTTGVAAIDYYLSDDIITPPAADDHFSERLWRLPRLWMAYAPPPDLPVPRPRAPNDPLVLGSFNNLGKVQDQCLDLWAEVLRALPEATLLLKDAFDVDDTMKRRLAARLQHHGIGANRVEFSGRVPQWRDHMEQYNKIDIALDTFPMNSGTTAYEALVMGTPMVALEGAWMGGRIGKDLLTRLGFPEWCARTREDYIDIVKRLASDRAALRGYKSTLQGKVLQSELCDGVSMARALDAAFHEMVTLKTRP